jgi:two-component system, NarL family, sensor kinase
VVTSSTRPRPSGEVVRLRARLAVADETLRAIRDGEVDAVVVSGATGPQVYTLHGADQAYRILIESMNEGALTLTQDMMVLYANQGFASMVKSPLSTIMGRSLGRFMSAVDHEIFIRTVRPGRSDTRRIQLLLLAGDHSPIPVSISIRRLAKVGSTMATIGLVVTDMSQSQRTEDLLRALTKRTVQIHESERGQVAIDLHDNITQVLCSILARCQVFAQRSSARGGTAKFRAEAIAMRDLLGQTAKTVERISRNLRPGVLNELGLEAVLRESCGTCEVRTGVDIRLTCVHLATRLPGMIELAVYRILEAALDNIEKHANARHVEVQLRRRNGNIQLSVKDDGVGFEADQQWSRRSELGGLGLLGMHERALSVGGTLTVKTGRGTGTEIIVRVPLLKQIAAAGPARLSG